MPTADRVVIDASAAMALVRAEPTSGVVAARVAGWQSMGVDLYVPAPFWLEVVNSLLRRHHRPGMAVIAAIHQLDELGFMTVDVDRPLVLRALDFADRLSLSAYDAAYLTVADSLDAALYSADAALLAAAGDRAIPVHPAGGHRLSEEPAPYGSSVGPSWPAYREVSAYLARLRAAALASDRPT